MPALTDFLKLQQELIDQLPDSFDVELKRLPAGDPYLTVKREDRKATKYGTRITIKGYKKVNPNITTDWRWVSQMHYVHENRRVRLGPSYWKSDEAVINYIESQSKHILSEGKIKNAIAAGALAAAAVSGGSTGGSPAYLSHDEHQTDVQRVTFKNFVKQHEARAKALAEVITDKYSIGSDLALKIAKLALKYEKPTFPQAEDILAVCGIESSFKPHAVSQLENDPAIGLMQVRPAVWGLNKQKLKGSIEEQIKVGAKILHDYYIKLKSKEAALHAYNIGITNYMKKKGLNPRYVPKFDDEREMYEGLSQAALEYRVNRIIRVWDDELGRITKREFELVRSLHPWTKNSTLYRGLFFENVEAGQRFVKRIGSGYLTSHKYTSWTPDLAQAKEYAREDKSGLSVVISTEGPQPGIYFGNEVVLPPSKLNVKVVSTKQNHES